MIMRYLAIVSIILAGVACSTAPLDQAQAPTSEIHPAPKTAKAKAGRGVETRYELRGYRDSATPSVRHEAHAIFRESRMPHAYAANLDTIPRETFPAVSEVRLPASDELAAELATQRKITAELRAVQAALAETEREMKNQLATLVRQSAEAMTVKRELEEERARQLSASNPPETTGSENVPAAVTPAPKP